MHKLSNDTKKAIEFLREICDLAEKGEAIISDLELEPIVHDYFIDTTMCCHDTGVRVLTLKYKKL